MSRNEMFLLLACAVVVSMMTNGPAPMLHAPPITISSLFSPPDTDTVVASTAMIQHSFDQQ